ncbi:hypothetical protein Mapa_001103 [Marchantia paleacea]|nr:hypothetical protein Mapa_001103 [Marchantia paleacea]
MGPREVLAMLLPIVLALVWSVSAQAPAPTEVRIACGTKEKYQTPERLWDRDWGYTGGSIGNLTAEKQRDSDFTHLRYWSMSDGPNNCYNITVPNGHYVFRFFFSFGQADNSNREPQFDVSLEGTLAYSLKPAWSNTDDTSYADSLLFVDDGTATACFHSTGHGNPAVVTIEILQLYEDAYDLGFGHWNHHYLLNAMSRVSCGAGKDAYGTTLGADPWGGDRYWSRDVYKYEGDNIDTVESSQPIRNVNIRPQFYPEAIYQGATITKFGGSVSYAFPIEPSQNYSIWLHFAEIGDLGITGPGQRVFDVLYNDEVLFPDVDIYALAGGPNAAVVLNKTLLVDGKALTLKFKPKVGDILVCAIEVYQVVEREFPTKASDVWALKALKYPMGIPSRMGWIGDPCVPQEHPWDGIACKLDYGQKSWLISGLELQNEGLRGTLTDDISQLVYIDHINLNDNSLSGPIPASVGNLNDLTRLDLANNKFNGTIPEALGRLEKLQELYLQNNELTGRVPATLAAGPVRGASFNFVGNPDLCGIPGLKACKRLSAGAIFGIILGVLLGCGFLVLCGVVIWKRRENIARAHKIMSPREAPYAASHTRANAPVKDVQLSRFGSFTEQRLMSVSGGSAPQSPKV